MAPCASLMLCKSRTEALTISAADFSINEFGMQTFSFYRRASSCNPVPSGHADHTSCNGRRSYTLSSNGLLYFSTSRASQKNKKGNNRIARSSFELCKSKSSYASPSRANGTYKVYIYIPPFEVDSSIINLATQVLSYTCVHNRGHA